MSKPKEIRIPRTTALFITGLGRILRQYFHFEITEHECWTFVQVAGWEECDMPGQCSWHGFSKTFIRRLERRAPWELKLLDSGSRSPCTPYQMSIYLGTGHVEVDHKKVDLRVRIEEMEHDVYGYYYDVRIWTRKEAGKIQKGLFCLMEDGDPYVIDKPIEAQPPRKIAFWKDAILVEHPKDN